MTIFKRKVYIALNVFGLVCSLSTVEVGYDLKLWWLLTLGAIVALFSSYFVVGNCIALWKQAWGVPGAEKEFYGD